MSPLKELHFFDGFIKTESNQGFEEKRRNSLIALALKLKSSDYINNTKRLNRFDLLCQRVEMNGDIERYRQYFRRMSNNKSVFCEISPSYASLNEDGFAAIKSLAEDVRLIFLLRNPIDRIWSALRMASKKRQNANCLTNFEKFIVKDRFSVRTNYQQTLSKVYTIFPKERVFVEFYENLFKPNTIKELCHFCGIAYLEPNLEKRVFEGPPAQLTPEMRQSIYNQYHHVYDWAEKEYGERLPASWRNDILAYRK